MELEKATEPQLLGGLYTLRGGLSALSVKYAQVKNFDSIYYQRLHSLADTAGGARGIAPDDTVEYAHWLQNGGFENELHRRYNSISSSYVEDKREVQYRETAKRYRKEATKFFILMSLLLILIAGIFVAVYFIKEAYFTDLPYWGALIAVLSAGLIGWGILGAAIVMSIIFLKKAIIALKDYRNSMKVYYAKRNSNISAKHADSKRVSKEIAIAKANIDKLPHIREWARRILDERNGLILPLIKYCNQYYEALYGEYKNFLDERDWKNLDLIIYEIETRRADSIKEALQLTDRELQTDRIVKTLGEATKAICYTISRGFFELQNTVKVCCDKICDKLDDISHCLENISKQMTVQSMQLAGISGQLANLTDAVNVGNCLRVKANVTSSQLCNEVYLLRNYS